MEITVKHEFTMSPELASFFSRVLAPGSELDTPLERMVRINKVEDEMEKESKEHVKAIEKVAEPVTESATSVSLEMVRAAVSEKASEKAVEGKTKRESLKELLTSFGAKNVTELDKAKYAEFLTAVNAL